MILRNCEIWYPQVNPKKPNTRFSKVKPSWDVQLRTTDKVQKKEWEAANIKVKAIVPDEGETYFSANLRKKCVKADGSNGAPPTIIDGELNDVDPTSIGNGSIGHVRVYQYEAPKDEGGTQIVSVLMGIQLIHHIVYVPKVHDDDFEEQEGGTTVVNPEPEEAPPEKKEDLKKEPTADSDQARETPRF